MFSAIYSFFYSNRFLIIQSLCKKFVDNKKQKQTDTYIIYNDEIQYIVEISRRNISYNWVTSKLGINCKIYYEKCTFEMVSKIDDIIFIDEFV